jgi:hypothetical protein
MKKISLVFVVLSLIGSSIFAQNADFRNTISIQTGASVFNIFKGGVSGINADSVRFTSGGFSNVPTIAAAWDYGVTKGFSIGLAGSYAQAKVSTTDLEVANKKGVFQKYGNYSIAAARTNLGIRALFHYGNKGRMDLYSGLRLGVGLWSVKLSGQIEKDVLVRAINEVFNQSGVPSAVADGGIGEKLKTKGSFVLFAPQLILFGLRGHVTNNIGINFELATGSPYAASLGLDYRF